MKTGSALSCSWSDERIAQMTTTSKRAVVINLSKTLRLEVRADGSKTYAMYISLKRGSMREKAVRYVIGEWPTISVKAAMVYANWCRSMADLGVDFKTMEYTPIQIDDELKMTRLETYIPPWKIGRA